MEKIINVREAAKILAVNPMTIKRHIARHKKYWFRLKESQTAKWLIDRSDFDLWAKELEGIKNK